MKRLAATATGAVLACLPFLLYGLYGGGHAHAAHTDHAPHHGGQLFMIGDYHVELVTRAGVGSEWVEIYLSDARRRPLRPRAGALSTRAGREMPLEWMQQRLIAELPRGARPARYRLTAPDGSTLELPAPR